MPKQRGSTIESTLRGKKTKQQQKLPIKNGAVNWLAWGNGSSSG